jgi:hypothetical protein
MVMWCKIKNCDDCPYPDCVLTDAQAAERNAQYGAPSRESKKSRYDHAWYLAHKDEKRAKNAAYYLAHREEVKARVRKNSERRKAVKG